MRKTVLLFLIVLFAQLLNAQEINGYIESDTSNFTVIKVWGTHYERGYAYGYLAGEGMSDIYVNYLEPSFGGYLSLARQWLEEENNIAIADEYETEAIGLIDGMNDAGINTEELDYLDVLVCNVYLDFMGFLKSKSNISPGCSALMSWGDATAGTDIDGKSVVSRHVDWSQEQSLIRNQVIVAHIPAETDEQPWIMIGFKGQISALSGVNDAGMAAFMHSLSDFNANADTGKAYEPIWFSMRKALEQVDYNQDGKDDVNDFRTVFLENEYGYPKASIISCLSSGQNEKDSLIALVAELTCEKDFHTFRTNAYDDTIPGDNLYAANYAIKRNNAQNYCSRYLNVVDNIGDGTSIGSQENWNILRDYSHATTSNFQFMQFIPDDRILKLSVTDKSNFAYEKDPVVFNIDSLFDLSDTTSTKRENFNKNLIKIYPNPVDKYINIRFAKEKNDAIIKIVNSKGQILDKIQIKNRKNVKINTGNYSNGLFLIYIIDNKRATIKKFIK